jgi:hypothetical protein
VHLVGFITQKQKELFTLSYLLSNDDIITILERRMKNYRL